MVGAAVRGDPVRDGLVGDGLVRDEELLWDISIPPRPFALPGVVAAGFTDRGVTPPELRLIPHPAVTVIIVFDGSITVDDGTGRRVQGSFVFGPGYGRALRSLQVDTFGCLQVRLSPSVARRVFGGAVAELGEVVRLDDLFGPAAGRLADQLHSCVDWGGRFKLIEKHLLDRRVDGPAMDDHLTWAWQKIRATRGAITVESLATDLGWSRKRLWSQFRSQIGITPKRAVKLVRFDHAVHDLVAGRSPAQVAADAGYSDQSHLHRDVASFTGRTPVTVAAEPFLAVDHVAWGWPAGTSLGKGDQNRDGV